MFTDTPNGPQIVCRVQLTATATGDGSARWQNGATYWYTGASRTTATDTTLIAANDVAATFGGQDTISGGETRHASWYFVGYVPFDLSIGFGYQTDDGTTGRAETRYRCGPDPATAVAPVISKVTYTSSAAALMPGDTVSVSYQVASSSGVWMTIVAAGGAFTARQVVGEHLVTNVTRTVKFVVPQQLDPGVPLTITVQTYDAALDTRATSLETQLAFAGLP